MKGTLKRLYLEDFGDITEVEGVVGLGGGGEELMTNV